jgi:predicted GNAT superfamily acetyltransferase
MWPAAMNDLEKLIVSKGRRFLLRVETSHEAEAYQKYEDLRNEIWGFPDDHLAGTRNMMCENFLAEGSSLFIGTFAEAVGGGFPNDAAHLAGFCYGFVGMRDKQLGFRNPENLRFYSQFTGVRREFQSYGLGIQVKEFQREIVLGRFGLDTVICTYDPLTGVNAHRNVHHFGMQVLEYRVATYGEYGGLLNRADVASDRFLMSWDLKSPRPERSFPSVGTSGCVLWVDDRLVRGRTGTVSLEVVRDASLDLDGDHLLVRIPLDFYRLLQETDVDDPEVRRIPVDWRLQTRRAFLALFGRGYRVADFLKAAGSPPGNYYLLIRG